MKTRYFSFGYIHLHEYRGMILNRDTLFRITSINPRKTMCSIFGDEWSMEYTEEEISDKLDYWPGGVVDVDEEDVL